MRYKNIIETLKERPILIIGKEHYGDMYYLIQSLDGLHKWALEILKEKFDQGFFPDPGELPKPPLLPPAEEFTDLKVFIQNKTKAYKENLKEYNRALEQRKDVERILLYSDGKGAYILLTSYSNFEFDVRLPTIFR